MGNLRSVEKAFEHVGVEAVRTRDHEVVRRADGVVLPGVGAFPRAMEGVRDARASTICCASGCDAGVPVLGLCVGMQLLFESLHRARRAPRGSGCWGVRSRRWSADGLKVPQIGWNPVSWRRPSRLAEGLPDPCPFYHVHSFAPRPLNGDVVGTATYGGEFASVVARAAGVRGAVPPREVRARRAGAACATSRACAAA